MQGMKKPWVGVVGGLAALAILAGLAMTFPVAAIVGIVMDSFRPQRVGWNAKNAWAKCDGAIAGAIDWPAEAGRACDAMHMCANEATLSAEQRTSLVAAARRLPNCPDP